MMRPRLATALLITLLSLLPLPEGSAGAGAARATNDTDGGGGGEREYRAVIIHLGDSWDDGRRAVVEKAVRGLLDTLGAAPPPPPPPAAAAPGQPPLIFKSGLAPPAADPTPPPAADPAPPPATDPTPPPATDPTPPPATDPPPTEGPAGPGDHPGMTTTAPGFIGFKHGRDPWRSHQADEVCLLRKVRGPCRAARRMWFYDAEEGECATFTYGGCNGNANRFPNKKACEEACGHLSGPRDDGDRD